MTPRDSKCSRPYRVLLVGQVPPPIHGQAMMIQQLLEGTYTAIEIDHVPMRFSSAIDDVGKFSIRKLMVLPVLIARILAARAGRQYDVLYYPPAGPHIVPIVRDIAILLATRWAFPRILFHIHAGGLSEIEPRLPAPLRWLFRLAYGRPTGAIRLSPATPPDPERLGALAEYILPNGVEQSDRSFAKPEARAAQLGRPIVLFVGSLQRSKGVEVLLAAAEILAERGLRFEVHLMGGFTNQDFQSEIRARLDSPALAGRVRLLGVQSGAEKDATFRRASVFCFPSFYESEAFPVVLLEAMRAGLPIVSTRWRGIPSIVDDGVNGVLVDTKDPQGTADALQLLLSDSALRAELAKSAREKYLRVYTSRAYARGFEEVVVDLCTETGRRKSVVRAR